MSILKFLADLHDKKNHREIREQPYAQCNKSRGGGRHMSRRGWTVDSSPAGSVSLD